MSRSSLPVAIAIHLFAFALLSLASGCGDGRFPIRPAKGKVMCQGQPVTQGSVTFTPIGESGGKEAGKPATAAIGPDGTFELSTHGRFDGAVVGKHSVQYVGPDDEEGAEEEETAPAEGSREEAAQYAKRLRERKAKVRYEQAGEIIVEVKSDGENDFTIEVVPAGSERVSESESESE